MKQGIEKVLEESEELIKKTVWGNICRDCSGGGADGEELCKKCGGCGIVDWQGTDELKSFLRSAIETAFKEVRPEDYEEVIPKGTEISLNHQEDVVLAVRDANSRGYNHALSNYDQAVKNYLGK